MDESINSKKTVCVVIPIYKNCLSKYEIISLRQCCKILIKYPIIFVTHSELDCAIYDTICKEYNILYKYEYFKKKYFSNLICYNALLLKKTFYTRFINYEYILIYQLDAYVFKDELEYWCEQKYDYIGAPWLTLKNEKTSPGFYNDFPVGNGGLSLRNIKKSIELYDININIISFIHLFQSCYNDISYKSRKNIFYLAPRILLRPILNIFKGIFFKKSDTDNNEDKIWSRLFQEKGNVPPPITALKFAFENYPEYLYLLNAELLPFGCHDWFKYYNYFFYQKYIK